MNSNIFEARGISVRYDGDYVLSDVSFDIEKGDYVGIVGPNGSGKTTLLKAMLGLIPVSSGSFKTLSPDKVTFGYLPQKTISGDRIFPATVREIISTGLLINKKEPRFIGKADHNKVDEIMFKLGISELAGRKIGSLSGGQQQRALLARALVISPDILILDEPTSALDPKIRDDFYLTLSKLNDQEKTTILLVTHDIGSLGKYTKKMLYLDRKIIFFGTYEEFCGSKEMTGYFGYFAQHQFCWRHVNE